MGYTLLRLYKYHRLDEWAFGNLANSTLYFNQFSTMNDPNEVLVHRRWGENIPRDESVLLCSLTEDRLNPMMGEQYADHFKGLCIGYDIPVQETTGNLLNNDGDEGMLFRKVSYFEEEELIRRPLNDSESQSAALDVFSEKTAEWKGEEEYRGLHFTNDSNWGRISYARPVGIDKRYLKSLAFGQKADSALSRAVYSLVNSLYPTGIAFSNARFTESAMELLPYA